MSSTGQSQEADSTLPEYLVNAWRLKPHDEYKNRHQIKGQTVSRLAKLLIDHQLHAYRSLQDGMARDSVSSLSSLAVGAILQALNTSDDIFQDAKTIKENLSFTTYRQLLNDPRLSYDKYRYLQSLTNPTSKHESVAVADIDEVIQRNERYVRSRGNANKDGRYLVHLKDLPNLIFGSYLTNSGSGVVSSLMIFRPDLPKGGLEVLDYVRNQEKHLMITATDRSFSLTFDRITMGILNGLDWSNIFMAGGMALTTLIHTKVSQDGKSVVKDPDIDLYIYGLSPENANAKVKHIYNIWCQNLPTTAFLNKLVVKNGKTINFLSTYPNRRVQVVLKLVHSPTEVLLNFDLDACALGWNGSEVLMLPRFVRALETGYSVFTMDLVWGHHLGYRRATQDSRVLKYADRGFGIRFPPSYVRSLEEAVNIKEFPEDTKSSKEVPETPFFNPYEQRDRFPYGPEPGLKTLKRIQYLGRDYVHRFYFGTTPLAMSYEQYHVSKNPDYEVDEDNDLAWQQQFVISEHQNAEVFRSNSEARRNGEACQGPYIKLAELDGRPLHESLPHGRRGLGILEIFMRHCEAWNLHAKADATLAHGNDASNLYDADTYSDIPYYNWNENFSIDEFASSIENANAKYWLSTKVAICQKLDVPINVVGYSDYATRRLRRQVQGRDLASVMEKQLTIPVIIPSDLEHYIMHTIPQRYTDLPAHFTDQPCLIPLHDPASYNGIGGIPSIQDTATEAGNLRYWIITNESVWAGQHRAIDEIFELLWSLFHWTMQQSLTGGRDLNVDTSNVEAVYHIARAFRRRIVMPEISETEGLGPGLPTKREAALFRPWALLSPVVVDRTLWDDDVSHDLFDDESVRYPFEDELFWKGDNEELGEEWKGNAEA